MSEASADIVVIVPVWGTHHTTLCTDFLLPSLLARGNLDAAISGASVTIAFCCPPDSQAVIKASPTARALSEIASLSFVDNSDLIQNPETKYKAMTESIYRVLNRSLVEPGRTILVFTNPDAILGAGMISDIRAALSGGHKAVMVPGLRTRLDVIQQSLEPFRRGVSLDVPASSLSRTALQTLHPDSAAYIWNEGMYPVHWQSLVFHRTEDGSLVMHSFHLHPIAIICPEQLPKTLDTIDGDFLEECGFSTDDMAIARNGDSMVVIEVSGEPYAFSEPVAKPSLKRLASFALYHTTDIHWFFFRHRITYSVSDRAVDAAPGLDRLVRYIEFQKKRRQLAKRWPRLDKKLVAPIFDLIGRTFIR
ncbi:MAG: hypothetical protein AAF557_04415 [Pseudomonadota bacterium]